MAAAQEVAAQETAQEVKSNNSKNATSWAKIGKQIGIHIQLESFCGTLIYVFRWNQARNPDGEFPKFPSFCLFSNADGGPAYVPTNDLSYLPITDIDEIIIIIESLLNNYQAVITSTKPFLLNDNGYDREKFREALERAIII